MEQILRKYVQPFEFSEFPWHTLRDIFLPQDRKTIKKKTADSFSPLTADHSRRFFTAISQARKKHFKLPLISIRSCGIVLTGNQRCGQNLAAVSTNVRELVSGPILAGARKRKCMRTAEIGPDLRLLWMRLLNFRVRVFLKSAVIPSKKNQSVLIAKISSRKTQKIANPQK